MDPCWLPAGCVAQAPRLAPLAAAPRLHSLNSPSPRALSTECPAPNGNLCSGLGICGTDAAAGSARCFCDDGYISADCSKPASPIPGGAIAGAFFGGLILAACSLLGYGFYLFRAKQGAVGAGAEGFYATVG